MALGFQSLLKSASTMNALARLVVGVALLLALYFLGARTRAPVIEDDIQTRTSAAMMSAGFGGVMVATDGRDVTLTGTVADAGSVETAGNVALDTWGVRVVDNRIAIGEYGTVFCRQGNQLVLEGGAPDEAEFARVRGDASLLFPHGTVDDQLAVREGAPDGYGPALEIFLREVVQLDHGCVTVEGTQAEFRGTVRSQLAADRIRQQGATAENLGFDVTYALDVRTLSDEIAACQEAYNERLGPGENVLFDFDSAELHEEGRRLLNEIAEIGALCPEAHALVTGHTDSVGDREYNVQLSEERARAVVDYLVSVGVDRDRLTPVGYGYSQPIADNSTEDGRALNRRIEIRVQEN
jgi:OOP family OmpA-OmpF porin